MYGAITYGETSFPGPKIFTNALLHAHDITALIRDTESHERALFSLAPDDSGDGVPLRTTIKQSKNPGEALLNGLDRTKLPSYGATAATLLGAELGERLRKEGGMEARGPGDLDVEVLLRGAEKLCSV